MTDRQKALHRLNKIFVNEKYFATIKNIPEGLYTELRTLIEESIPMDAEVIVKTETPIKVIINDTLKQIVVEAHLAGQTVIAGNGEIAYAEKYYNESFSE